MKQIIALLLALPLLLVACDNEEGSTPEPTTPRLELTSDEMMTFEAMGGKGTINYKFVTDNETEGNNEISELASEVGCNANVEWITICPEESLPGSIIIAVAANESNEERTGTITVSYNSDSFDVTVKQQAAEDAPVEAKEWAVIGSMTNNWDIASAIAMEKIDGYYAARGVEISSSDSFIFILNGSMQNSLCSDGRSAERDCKYPTQKYGSDIRVKESGKYDLYLNELLTTYYVMSEGKSPAEAHEIVAPGEDVWYVSGLGEEIRMHEAGLFILATKVTLDADGFMIRNTITGAYGAATDAEVEVGEEINIVANAENNIKVKHDANKTYDIYIKVDELKVWVVESGQTPSYMYECTEGEGAWFDSGKNFYLHLTGEGIAVTIECMLCNSAKEYIIPETTFVMTTGEDSKDVNYIVGEGCLIANMDGKTQVIGGEISVKHIDEEYEITVDVINHLQHRILAHYRGKFKHGMVGYPILTPNK